MIIENVIGLAKLYFALVRQPVCFKTLCLMFLAFARSNTWEISLQKVSESCFGSCSFEHIETEHLFVKRNFVSWSKMLLWTSVLHHNLLIIISYYWCMVLDESICHFNSINKSECMKIIYIFEYKFLSSFSQSLEI